MAARSIPSRGHRGVTIAWMAGENPLWGGIYKLLKQGDLSFQDFMEAALYDPAFGYYSGVRNRVGKGGDYVTAPSLSPVFAYALARLAGEFLSRTGDEVSTIVDIGCGDGLLIHSLYEELAAVTQGSRDAIRFFGVDRSLDRVRTGLPPALHFVRSLDEVPEGGAHLLIANELFDAFPFSRLVQRSEGLHELTVVERHGELDWDERPARPAFEDYFDARGISLAEGQFVDLSLEWESYYAGVCRRLGRGLVVVFDYGYRQKQLFDGRVRRFGTAAAYQGHRVSRDLLARPGEQDLTAHVNFDDLIRAGENEGLTTLYFDRQAKFLLALGAAGHDLLRPIDEMEMRTLEEGVEALALRDEARRLLLPDGIGDEIRVLVQQKGLGPADWSFQRPLFQR